jgi:hypothetical protein
MRIRSAEKEEFVQSIYKRLMAGEKLTNRQIVASVKGTSLAGTTLTEVLQILKGRGFKWSYTQAYSTSKFYWFSNMDKKMNLQHEKHLSGK